MKGKTRKKANRVFVHSFFLTFLVLTLATVTLYYLVSQLTVQHLPATYDFKRADWMKYVSPGAEKFSFMNFSQILMKTGNESPFLNDRLLVIYNFSIEIDVPDTEFSVSVLYRNPDPNLDDLALNIIKPKQDLYLTFGNELEEKAEMEFPYKSYTVIQVTGHVVSKPAIVPDPTPEYVKGYIVMDKGYLLYSEGTRGLDIIKQSLDTAEGSNQFFEQQQVRASLYLLLSKTGDELGFSYSTLPYPVGDVSSTSTSVHYDGSLVATSYVFAFTDANTASNSLDKIKKANLEAKNFQIVDNYIVVTTKFESNLLLRELRSL